MLKIRVIPCLDVKDGRVVKGVNFVDLRDAGDPVEQAKIYIYVLDAFSQTQKILIFQDVKMSEY